MQVVVASLSRDGQDLTHTLQIGSSGAPACLLLHPTRSSKLSFQIRPMEKSDLKLVQDTTLPSAILKLTCTTLAGIQEVILSFL